MLCVPTASDVVLKVVVVTPAAVDTVPLPMIVAPSLKSTVPDGLAPAVLPGAVTLTVAVKVTDWPNTVGVPDVATVTVVSALLTTWLTVAEVAALTLVSPEYVAVKGCVATLRVDVVQVALPAASATALQIVVTPSLTVTVAVGEPGVTVAVNVTDCPYTDGVPEVERLTTPGACVTVWPPARLRDALALKLPAPL